MFSVWSFSYRQLFVFQAFSTSSPVLIGDVRKMIRCGQQCFPKGGLEPQSSLNHNLVIKYQNASHYSEEFFWALFIKLYSWVCVCRYECTRIPPEPPTILQATLSFGKVNWAPSPRTDGTCHVSWKGWETEEVALLAPWLWAIFYKGFHVWFYIRRIVWKSPGLKDAQRKGSFLKTSSTLCIPLKLI